MKAEFVQLVITMIRNSKADGAISIKSKSEGPEAAVIGGKDYKNERNRNQGKKSDFDIRGMIDMFHSALISRISESLSDREIRRLEWIRENASIHCFERCSHSLSEESSYFVNGINIEPISQVMDFLPDAAEKGIIWDPPALILFLYSEEGRKNRIEMVLHELSHLFSVGSYEAINSEMYIHSNGIGVYQYLLSTDRTVLYNSYQNEALNELCTDTIAGYFFNLFTGATYSNYEALDRFIELLRFKKIGSRELMYCYFSENYDKKMEYFDILLPELIKWRI